MLRQLWKDEDATVITAEMMILTSMLVIGIIVGAKSFRDASVTEWGDFAQAIADLDQSYNIPDSGATRDGSGFLDQRDFCDTAGGGSGWVPSSNWGLGPRFQTLYGTDAFGEFNR